VAGDSRVLVDTSAWIDYFAGDVHIVPVLDGLMQRDLIVTCGQVVMEVLQGTRDERAFSRLERKMAIWTYEAETAADFRAAALVYARLRWKGVTVPTSDCLIAAVAQRCDVAVCATDPHFSSMPGLKLFGIQA
jgi:predicted nucleic acid-binding protein